MFRVIKALVFFNTVVLEKKIISVMLVRESYVG